jgi:hypothetical protein
VYPYINLPCGSVCAFHVLSVRCETRKSSNARRAEICLLTERENSFPLNVTVIGQGGRCLPPTLMVLLKYSVFVTTEPSIVCSNASTGVTDRVCDLDLNCPL